MDPISLVLTALAAGASASIKDTASTAIKDAYSGLKSLIQRKFADRSTADVMLAEYEKNPDIWKAPLEQKLKETGVDHDQEIIEAAQKLLEQVDPQQAVISKYHVSIKGNVQGFAQGDNQQVTINFGNEPSNI